MNLSRVFLLSVAAACSLLPGGVNPAQAQVQFTWANFAGHPGGPGTTDGAGREARFNYPFSVAADATGNLYMADTASYTIRKVTPDGVVSTLAGLAGVEGSADGAGSAARFKEPRGVAVDASGNVFVADTFSNTIRKITPAGVVSTFAGLAYVWGYVDATGSDARFNRPSGITVDAGGNLYVAEYYNQTIRKITPAGVVTTLAGQAGYAGSIDGTGTAARFGYPYQVAADPSGNVYVADTFGNCIRKVTPSGVVTTIAGSAGVQGSADGGGSAARFYYPYGVTADANGNVYVADSFNHTIRKITSAGVVTTLAGMAGVPGLDNGAGSAARFSTPSGLATDPSGNMFVADTDNSTLRKLTPAGVVTTLAGAAGSMGDADGIGSAAKFRSPSSVATDPSGNVYVADSQNHTIRKITPAGTSSTFAGLAGTSGFANGTILARFKQPSGVAADAAGNVYVADSGNHSIRKITSAGLVSTLAGNPNYPSSADGVGTQAHFNYPIALALDADSNAYVADYNNHTIRKITPAAVVTTLAGQPGSIFYADGAGSAARFAYPSGVAVGAGGVIYVADAMNSVIRKVTPSGTIGIVSTLAGQPTVAGSLDGVGSAAQFYGPAGVAVDAAGDLYVSDSFNHTIRRVTPGGAVSTVGGLAGQSGGADGGGVTARFNRPAGLAFDAAGSLFVADQFNNRIIRGAAFQPLTLFRFTDWQASYFAAEDAGNAAVVGMAADLDGDGLGNLLEYAFGLDPGTADAASAAPQAGRLGGYATLTFRRLPSRTDLNYLVEATDDVATGAWTVIARSVGGGPTTASPKQGASSVNETVVGSVVQVTVGDVVPAGPATPRRLLRLRVARP